MLNTKALAASVSAPPAVYVEDVFSTYLYTGNGSTQTITNGIDLAGEGGLVWIKGRSGATGHRFTDTARGATKSLESNSTAAEATESTGLTSFSSTGFALGADADYSTNAATYASWTFRKAPKFFDVVTYTGNGSNRTIAHNLGSVPGSIIVKRTDTTANWAVYHRSLANTQYLVLDSTAAAATGATWWNSTTPTSSVFSVGTDASVNASGGTYVAYVFAHDAGGFGLTGTDNVISCGSTNGSKVTLGYEPQWILYRSSNFTDDWQIVDNMRGLPVGAVAQLLKPNTSGAETTTSNNITIAADGFTLGAISGTAIYIAIRRGPMKVPTDATKVYNGVNDNSGLINVGFVPDLALINTKAQWDRNPAMARLTGTGSLRTNATSAQETQTIYWDKTTGYFEQSATGGTPMSWFFGRAPGYFDVVCYTGTGSNRTISHNLAAVPELMIVKQRGGVSGWPVYAAGMGNTKAMRLNSTQAEEVGSDFWNNTTPTSTVFSLGNNGDVNQNTGTYVAYLFATLTGISKVGSYTGTGTTLNIDCGFTAGARFVMIKRTDSTGDWFVWDTARGIISGDDPYLLLNSTAAEVTNTDYIDPLSSGFQISSTAPAAINANGGSFIFLAIA